MKSVWRSPEFVKYLTCRTLLVTARQMLSVAIGWDVYTSTGNVVDLGLIGLFTALPILMFSIPGGIVADRVDRKIVIVGSLSLYVLSSAAIGFLSTIAGVATGPIFFFLFLSGTAHAFLIPTLHSVLPRLVPRNVFSNAIAATSAANKIAQLAGPVGAGLLMASLGGHIYLLVAMMFLVSAVFAVFIRTDLRIVRSETFDVAQLAGGFRYIWETPPVFAAITLDLVAVLFGGIMGILPVYASDILGVGSQGLGLMRAAPAVGALVVGVYLAFFRLPWPVGRAFFMSLAMFALAVLLFSASSVFWLSVFSLTVYGAADMVSVYVRQSLVQMNTPDDLRGRVSGVYSFASGGSTQLSDFRAGLMAGLVGAPASVAIGGLVTMAAAAFWAIKFPQLTRLNSF